METEMIVIVPLDGQSKEYFEDYNELFDYIIAIENEKLITSNANFKQMNRSFTIHPPKHVTAFYACLKNTCEAIKEANDENTALIEICIGDFNKPLYIALTPTCI
jgi:hypothetical protein